ncbi:hypothetical protein Bpfe_019962 [Biomphalaria pfeifferi]|uniref:Uncharacterized protein n=1 Tax=Biomphalaria pfeifferi TaxID=112525 RepID=A0AAD8BC16_BIOPF|nr:hypothetical protein Bpfe_019962 [Biomphalaria pfeifferi]
MRTLVLTTTLFVLLTCLIQPIQGYRNTLELDYTEESCANHQEECDYRTCCENMRCIVTVRIPNVTVAPDTKKCETIEEASDVGDDNVPVVWPAQSGK